MASASRILLLNSVTLAGGFCSSSWLKTGMPSSSKVSRIALSGTSLVAARRAARLYDPRRRLPAIPRMRIGVFICHQLTHSALLMNPKVFAQNLLQYFAGAALRKLGFGELDAAWNFEIGERSSAVRDQLFRSECFARLENNDSLYDFAPFRIGYSEDRHFAHGWMRVNDGFDFAGINVFSAGDDHVLQAIENVEVPVGVLVTNVARSEEAVPEREFSFFRLVPITAHDIRAARDQLASFPGFNFVSFWIDNTHVDSEARSTGRGEFVFSVLMIQQAGEEPGFTQPVDLNEFNLWQNLSGAMHEFRSHWRSAISQMPKSREVILLQLRRLRQHVDHRRHQHRVRDAFALDCLAETFRAELWNSDLTGAKSRRGEHERKVRDVKNRRCM